MLTYDAVIVQSTGKRFVLYFKGKKVLDCDCPPEDAAPGSDPGAAFLVIGCVGVSRKWLQNETLTTFPDKLADIDETQCRCIARFQ